MIPWIVLDTAKVPGGRDELRLKQRGSEFSIMLGTNELMNSRLSGSEEALAKLSWEKIKGRAKPKMLIGGLGMGFTLRAALKELPADAEITVAELVPAVVAWARGPMADVYGDCLSDPRVTIREDDVADLINARPKAWDAILLDVDNGPEALTRDENDQIYAPRGLRSAKTALTPGGVLSVWSSAPDPKFTRRLQASGFTVEEARAKANGRGKGGGARHMIWLATA
ncbi:spermidine synthase [Rhizobium panacihumi]|uniref:spermidine synthase n=1 Tax=Rhizobium panacihumi TaxID=2008450 RepID=UPI003D792F65